MTHLIRSAAVLALLLVTIPAQGATILAFGRQDVALRAPGATGSVVFEDGLITLGPGCLTGFSLTADPAWPDRDDSPEAPAGWQSLAFSAPGAGFTATFDPAGALAALTFDPSNAAVFAIDGTPVDLLLARGSTDPAAPGILVALAGPRHAAIPEPAGPTLFGMAVSALALLGRGRRRAHARPAG